MCSKEKIIKELEGKGLVRVIKTYRPPYLKTKRELALLNLKTDESPIAFSINKKNEIKYYYNSEKAIEDINLKRKRIKVKKYRENLLRNKTCSKCKEIQKHVKDIEIYNDKRYCYRCIKEIKNKY